MAGEVTHIPSYKPSTGSNIGIFNVANRIKSFQDLFKVRGTNTQCHSYVVKTEWLFLSVDHRA